MSTNPAPAPVSGLQLYTYSWDTSTVVQCTGRLTLQTAPELKDHVRGLIPNNTGIILDMKGLTRLDSAGLGTLVALYVAAKKAKCEFLLANYNQSIRDLFGVTNLLSVFETAARTGMRIP